MSITIVLPQVGETVTEGIIGKWLKKPGDQVEKYDPLVEVVTDKVTMEMPSPVAGIMVRCLVSDGDTVPVGMPIAEIESADGDEGDAASAMESLKQKLTDSGEGSSIEDLEARGVSPKLAPAPDTIGYLAKDVKPVGPTGGGVEEATGFESKSQAFKKVIRYSPAVRRLMAEHSINISLVKGTGINERVMSKDVLQYIEQQNKSASAVKKDSDAEEETVALTPVRRIIASNMAISASEIPHAWSMVEVDVTSLVSYREEIKESFRRREGVGITYLPFVIKAVTEALKENPGLNSSWAFDKIIRKKRINIGVAVAAPDGLVVPVIHDADDLSIDRLACVLNELSDKARQRQLTLEDVGGGSFTVNNTGTLGSIVSFPIINHPQAAILTSESIVKRPVVIQDAIVIRSVMNLCFSFDHRVLDGAESAVFLQGVKQRLEYMGKDMQID